MKDNVIRTQKLVRLGRQRPGLRMDSNRYAQGGMFKAEPKETRDFSQWKQLCGVDQGSASRTESGPVNSGLLSRAGGVRGSGCRGGSPPDPRAPGSRGRGPPFSGWSSLSRPLEHGSRRAGSGRRQQGLHGADVLVGFVHHRERFLQGHLSLRQRRQQHAPVAAAGLGPVRVHLAAPSLQRGAVLREPWRGSIRALHHRQAQPLHGLHLGLAQRNRREEVPVTAQPAALAQGGQRHAGPQPLLPDPHPPAWAPRAPGAGRGPAPCTARRLALTVSMFRPS